MTNKPYVGIDPGAQGAIAIVNGLDFTVTKYKDRDSFDSNNELPRDTPVLIEDVHAMPTDGRSSAFTFGKNTGAVTEFARMRGFTNVGVVAPTTWQAEFNLQKFNLPFGFSDRKPFHRLALYKEIGLYSGPLKLSTLEYQALMGVLDLIGQMSDYKVNGVTPVKVINQYVDAMLIAFYCQKVAPYLGRK